MCKGINYAESAHGIIGAIKEANLSQARNLQSFMEKFEHIRMREGYILDAYYSGCHWGAHYNLYARRNDASEPFIYSAYQAISTPLDEISKNIDYIEYEDEEEEEF